MLGKENFCCETNLLKDVLDTLEYISTTKADDYSSVAILCQEDLSESLLKHACVLTALSEIDLDINFIDLDKVDYWGEYGLIFSLYDGELSLCLEKATYSDGTYKHFDMDYLYISKDCDISVIIKHAEHETDVFSIGHDC